jgi:hypothetical protein
MSQNNSDYKLGRPDVHNLLPAIHQNPLSKALAETTFNRFYTKPELQRVIGTIGQRKTSSQDDQIVEPSTYDQAFQLQPAIKNSAASEVQITTYKDIKRLCEQLGIDTSRVQEWQNAEQFNYALPINLDKITNYNEYYWSSETDPEYVVIENKLTKLQAQLSQMASHYPSADDKLALWADIEFALNAVNTFVAADQRISIPNLTTIIADPIHPPYIFAQLPGEMEGMFVLTSDWAIQNKWIHRLDVADLSLVKQAKMPIIEYNDNIQLTEYTYRPQVWQYRRSASFPWEINTTGPARNELFDRMPVVASSRDDDTITVAGDQTSKLSVDQPFTIEGSELYNGKWNALSVDYFYEGDVTVIHVDGNLTTDNPSGTVLPFATTSLGDDWKGLFNHWMLVELGQPLPTMEPALAYQGNNGEQFTAIEGQTDFALTTMYLFDGGLARVYLNGRRQYGTYTELPIYRIRFTEPLSAGDVVEIYPNAIAEEDQGKEMVMVRVSEDDDAPLELRCLIKYRKQEQYKTARNQYPLFNVVDVKGNALNQSTSIVTFTEDSTADVDADFGSRIKHNTLTKEFTFDIDLVAADDTLRFYINSDDGTTASVWSNAALYVPTKVNADRMPVGNEDPDGVYEIPQQLMKNAHHECRRQLSYSELFLHFKSIVDNQPPADPSIYGVNLTPSNSYRLQENINYALGGTIKEHSYSFDNFVSSLISSNFNLPSILAFAATQYNELLVRVRENVEQNIVASLNSLDNGAVGDLIGFIEGKVLTTLRNDTALSRIYGDSSVTTRGAITNWIATLPYLRMSGKSTPQYIRDDKRGILEMVHHDGHRSLDELNSITSAVAKANIIKTLNLYPNGVQQPYVSAFDAQPGEMWYNATRDQLFRFSAIAVTTSIPDARVYPAGAMYLNPITQLVYQNVNSAWEETTLAADVLWKEFDLVDVVASVLLRIEQRLADSVPEGDLWIDNLPEVDAGQFAALMQTEFEEYCKANRITAPYRGDFDITDAFTWNYSTVLTGEVRWDAIYQSLYGTSYPHLEPWKLQGFEQKPTWWDFHYDGATQGRRWNTDMWANINFGILPVEPWSVAPVPQVPVNQFSHTTVDGYGPDDLFPPYWEPSSAEDVELYADYPALLTVMPATADIASNNFYFGQDALHERAWKKTLDYKYAEMRSMFRLDPIRFTHYTFGEEFTSVNGLEVCNRTSKVLSHRDVIFHGDTDNNGVTQLFDGVNQLFVNFFRYNALDLNASEFKRAWTSWTTQLCYSVGSFVIDNTLSIDSGLFEMTPNDYSVEVKTARHVRDVWVDALYASIAQAGSPREIPMGAGRDWKFDVATHCPAARTAFYYGVKKYRVTSDLATNTFSMVNGTIELSGWVAGSPVVFDLGVQGLLPNAIDDLTYYFIIPVNDTTFMLANSKEEALIGHNINLVTNGSGVYSVAELTSTFYSLEGKHTPVLWKHFSVNKRDLRSFSTAVPITGIQNVVDFVDGYSLYLTDQGIVFNDSSVLEYDDSNNRQITWQFEVESFIDTLYLNASNVSRTNSMANLVGEIEMNPFRNNIWLTHPTGVVSEFNTVDSKDSSAMAIVYDNRGNRIDTRNFHALRQDTITHIAATNQILDGAQTDNFMLVPDNVPFGGVHAYFDEYEHVLMFNPYTISNALVFDSFLGVAVSRLQAYFEKQQDSTKRPNIGGFVLKDGKFVQNYEYTTSNILKYYDTFTVNENSDFVNYARRMLGYTPNATYMTNTNVTPKSQFLFYKGMIKAKGTTGSIEAFTNSKHFQSAAVDEFWAYRAFDFGDNRPDVHYTMNLVPQDTISSHAKIQFVATPENTVQPYFTKVPMSDVSRWPNFPAQAASLSDSYALFGTVAKTNAQVSIQLIGARYIAFHTPGDVITVYQPVGAERSRTTGIAAGVGSVITMTGQTYLPNSGALNVFINGALRTVNVDYTEISDTSIQVIGNFGANAVVVIVPHVSTFVEGVHYHRLTNGMIQMVAPASNVWVTTRAVDYATLAPIHVYDEKAKTVVQELPAWDPIAGIHQATLAQYVDTYAKADPAVYNLSPSAITNGTTKFWNKPEVGNVWLDTNSFDYVSYKALHLTTNEKLVNWGKMEEWSDPAVYQWVESTVAPKDFKNGTPRSEVYSRSRVQFTATVSSTALNLGVVHGFSIGDDIVINADTLPHPLKEKTVYTVGAGSTFTTVVVADRAGVVIPLTMPGEGVITVSPATFKGAWTKVVPMVEHYYTININGSTLTTGLPVGSEFAMFADGVFVQDGPVLAGGVIDIEPETMLAFADSTRVRLTVIRKTGIIDGLLTTVPADLDLTPASEQSYVGYPHTKMDHVAVNGVSREPLYYFWVRGMAETIDSARTITTSTLEKLVSVNDRPYVICMNEVLVNGESRLSQLVLAGTAGIVSEPNRYTLRIRKNYTLRHQLNGSDGSMLKPTHAEWIMFRQNQDQHIDRSLWNMVTEAVIGHTIADADIAVPSLDRTIYDSVNGTSTRFGIGAGQTFVDGTEALETILLVLNSPEIDFEPIDIDYFLENHKMNTTVDLLAFMNDLYDSFPAKHVNQLFFAVMMDALANIDVDYSGSLMKTSAISINGTTPLNVNGEFDE